MVFFFTILLLQWNVPVYVYYPLVAYSFLWTLDSWQPKKAGEDSSYRRILIPRKCQIAYVVIFYTNSSRMRFCSYLALVMVLRCTSIQDKWAPRDNAFLERGEREQENTSTCTRYWWVTGDDEWENTRGRGVASLLLVFSENVTYWTEWYEEVSHTVTRRQSAPGRGNSGCKCPKTRLHSE